jgi:hypothetical protein
MRVPFANRLKRFGRGNDEAEAGQIVDLNEPVILFPAEHESPHQEIERARWKRPAVLVASTAIVSVLGAGAGIVILRGAGDGGTSAANAGPFTVEMSASALPDEDLRIAPTARDGGPTTEPEVSRPAASRDQGAGPATASRIDQPSVEPVPAAAPTRQPVPVAAESLGAERRIEPVPPAPFIGESSGVALADARPSQELLIESGPVIDTTPAVQLPASDPGSAGAPAARAVPEPPPPFDSFANQADRSSARPALLAGVERLIDAINAKNGEQRVRPLLLDPVSEKPTAALGTLDDVQFDGAEATISVSVGFTWRGSFGVEERETRRFLAVARRDGGEWRFTGVRLTGDLP